MALSKYSPTQVIAATCSPLGIHVFWGNESDQWKEWLQAFDRLVNHPDEEIRALGQAGKAYAQERYETNLASERVEAVYGRHYDR